MAGRDVTIFVSSPSDVAKEREEAVKVIDTLERYPFVEQQLNLKPLLYEEQTPAVMGTGAQATVDWYMGLPASCDIVVVILHARMGTAFEDEATGEKYASGTHYEFLSAYKLAQSGEKPFLLLYRCVAPPPKDHDPSQKEMVDEFFDEFVSDPPRFKGIYGPYETPERFHYKLHRDLSRVLQRSFLEAEPGEDSRWRSGSQARKARRRYLEDMTTDLENRLRQSIHHAYQLDIDIKPGTGATHLPWIYQPADRQETFSSFSEAYESYRGRILILGAPGSGKTTTLWYLAQRLVREAMEDPGAPIPILVNLSRYVAYDRKRGGGILHGFLDAHSRGQANDEDPMEDWLVSMLTERPGISESLVRAWMRSKRVIYLLDGLDEVDESYVREIALALNRSFLKRHDFESVVICSRTEEYKQLQADEDTRLQLQGAVELQPLGPGQIDAYLANTDAEGLREAMPDDEALQEMARTPLTLSMMALAYGGRSAEEIRRSTSLVERRRHMFDAYVDSIMQRTARRAQGVPWDTDPTNDVQTPYLRPAINHHLGWLAVRMSERMQTEVSFARLFSFLEQGKSPRPDSAFRVVRLVLAWLLTGVVAAAFVAAGLIEVVAATALTVGIGLVGVLAPIVARADPSPLELAENPSEQHSKLAIWGSRTLVAVFGSLLAAAASIVLGTSTSALMRIEAAPEAMGFVVLALFVAGAIASEASSKRERGLWVTAMAAIVACGALLAVTSGTPFGLQNADWMWAGLAWLVVFVPLSLEASGGLRVAGRALLVAAVAVVGLLVADWIIGQPDGHDVLALTGSIVMLLLAFSGGSGVAGMVVVGVCLGALVGGIPGSAFGGAAGALARATRFGKQIDAVWDRCVFTPITLLALKVLRKLPLGLQSFLGYCSGVFLLKPVGSDYSFQHRLLRDHFAMRDLLAELRATEGRPDPAVIDRISYQGASAFDTLVELSESPDPTVRANAVAVMTRIAVPEAVRRLGRAMVDPEPAVRAAAVRAASRTVAKEDFYVRGLADPAVEVRRASLEVIVRQYYVRDPPTDSILEILRSEDTSLHELAFAALEEHMGQVESHLDGHDIPAEHIIRLASTRGTAGRVLALRLLRGRADPKAVAWARSLLRNRAQTVRAVSGAFLCATGDPSVLPSLVRLLKKERDAVVRHVWTEALDEYHPSWRTGD